MLSRAGSCLGSGLCSFSFIHSIWFLQDTTIRVYVNTFHRIGEGEGEQQQQEGIQ